MWAVEEAERVPATLNAPVIVDEAEAIRPPEALMEKRVVDAQSCTRKAAPVGFAPLNFKVRMSAVVEVAATVMTESAFGVVVPTETRSVWVLR